MGNLAPNLPPGETEYTFKLLSLIADPQAAKARLAELVAQESSASTREIAAQDAERKASVASSKADQRNAALDDLEKSLRDEHDRKAKVLTDREININDREIDLGRRERDLADRERSLAQGLSDVKAREGAVSVQEQVTQDNSAALQKTQAQWKAKLEAIQTVIKDHFS